MRGNMKPDSAIPGILCLLVLAACVSLLTCCGTEYPVTLSIHSDYGKASYSSKAGLEIIVEK